MEGLGGQGAQLLDNRVVVGLFGGGSVEGEVVLQKKDLLVLKTASQSKFVGGANAGKSRVNFTYIPTTSIVSISFAVAQ